MAVDWDEMLLGCNIVVLHFVTTVEHKVVLCVCL